MFGSGRIVWNALDNEWSFVERRPCRIALRWPLCVAINFGGYLFNCLTVNPGNVVR